VAGCSTLNAEVASCRGARKVILGDFWAVADSVKAISHQFLMLMQIWHESGAASAKQKSDEVSTAPR
jgi:hypothetical protein